MKFSSAFVHKIEGAFDKNIEAQYAALENYSACAGIKDDEENAYKARVNHFGVQDKYIPARPFVDAPFRLSEKGQHWSGKYAAIVEESIKKTLTPVLKHKEYILTPEGGDIKYVRGKAFGTGDSPKNAMQKIAEAMKDAQIIVIQTHDFRKKHNSPKTIELKGQDYPLVDTGDMIHHIKAWVEER